MRGEFLEIGPESGSGTVGGAESRRLYYYAAGTRGVGDTVVLVHGFPMSSRLWHGVTRDFLPGHRLVVADLPGYGRSDPPVAGADTSAGHAVALRALMDRLGIARAVLVGHGVGGAAVQALMAMAPERVCGAVLISCPALGMRVRPLPLWARLLAPIARHLPSTLLAGLVHGSVRRGFADPEASRMTLDSCLQAFLAPHGRVALLEHLRGLGRDDTSQWSDALAGTTVPVAVLWGARDPFIATAVGERLRAHIPNATLDLVPEAAHFVPEDAPARTRQVIEALLARM